MEHLVKWVLYCRIFFTPGWGGDQRFDNVSSTIPNGKRGGVLFYMFVSGGKRGFLVTASQNAQEVKRTFFSRTQSLFMTFPSTRGKSTRSQEYLLRFVCDIDEA